tara:strand:- start:2334 stop:4199 length:1866 start_codon:yes stop_codon:yes gene_type:complete
MTYHSNPSSKSLESGINDIIARLGSKDIPIKIYGFGSKIDTSWINGEKIFTDASTNIGQVINHIKQDYGVGPAGAVIITDGQANQGMNISISDLSNKIPIHIIGIGNKDPLVDIAILSINAPPVIIKGENAEIEVLVTSYGIVDQRVNVTLYSYGKLLGSKILLLSGEGSINKIRFMINPEETGEIEYNVQVNALPEEVNILNNKQVLPIQVLKNEYSIALITGAPNFNTSIIKHMLNTNEKFKVEHYYLTKNGYSYPMKQFWDTKYDLILFDNHPVNQNAKEWKSFLRIFAKKLLSQKTSFGIFLGNDVDKKALSSYLGLMDLNINEPLIQLGSEHSWDFSKNWDLYFPFNNDDLVNKIQSNYPPLHVDLEIDSLNSIVLANFLISNVRVPLIQLAEKSPLRYMVFSSPDLHQLFYKTQNKDYQDLTSEIFNPLFSWLIRTGNGQDFYFRTGKNSYQQGEKVTIIGKAVRETEIPEEAYIHIYSQEKKINSKPVVYDSKTGFYKGQFWASKTGKLEYDIELIYGDRSLIVSEGSFQVQESQIELDHVFLNEGPLVQLSEATDGSFHHWSDRLSILNKINRQSNNQKSYTRIIMHNNWWIFFIIIFILTLEWLYRRRIGMI